MATMECEIIPLNEVCPLVSNMIPLYEMPGYNVARSSIGKYKKILRNTPTDFKASYHLTKWESRMEALRKMCRERNRLCEAGVQTDGCDTPTEVVRYVKEPITVVANVSSEWKPSPLSWV